MKRLIEKIVFSGLVIACRRATWPTSLSPDLDIATTEGVRRAPSALGITVGSPPSMTATTELVVPRSIPNTCAISCFLLICFGYYCGRRTTDDRRPNPPRKEFLLWLGLRLC